MKEIVEKFLKNNQKDIEYLSKNSEKVIITCAEINKSWSRTLAGSNGLLYYKNFEEPDMRNRFNTEWGCIHRIPDGWHKSSDEEFDNKFKESIEKDFDIKNFDKISNDIFKEVGKLKEDILTEAYRLDIKDDDLEKIKEIEIGKNPKDFIAKLVSGVIQTRDSQAIMEGRAIPTHLYYQGTAQGARSIIDGLEKLETTLERIEIKSSNNTKPMLNKDNTLNNLNNEISKKAKKLYKDGHYDQAVEAGFKVVRDRLRTLTSFETGSEAFGKGKLSIDGCSAINTERDFNEGVKFLTMAIDQFRNDKAHTSNNILDPKLAFKYLILSSLAMDLLENAKINQ